MLSMLLLAPAQAQPRHLDRNRDANAALQYWQAITLMPALDKTQEKLVDEWYKAPLDTAAKKLIADCENSMLFLRRAAKLPQCDWALEYDDGISLLLPHIAKARTLSRLAALHARQAFESGNRAVAQEDAKSIMVMARHIGRDSIMICILVRFAIEHTVVDLLAPYVPELNVPREKVLAEFAALPPGATLEESIHTEKRFMVEWLLKKLKDAEQTKNGSWRIVWKGVLDIPEASDAIKNIESLEKAVQMTEALLPLYDELAKLLALPNDGFDTQYAAFQERWKAANPLAAIFLPAVNKIRAAEQRNTARMEMLLAAFAVAQDGPDALKTIKDPFGKGPFAYEARGKGFELRSVLKFDNKPVTLSVGKP